MSSDTYRDKLIEAASQQIYEQGAIDIDLLAKLDDAGVELKDEWK